MRPRPTITVADAVRCRNVTPRFSSRWQSSLPTTPQTVDSVHETDGLEPTYAYAELLPSLRAVWLMNMEVIV